MAIEKLSAVTSEAFSLIMFALSIQEDKNERVESTSVPAVEVGPTLVGNIF